MRPSSGWPGGAAAACLLAGAGRSTVLFEREAGPRHKVCGEFISVEAAAYLASLGLDPERLGALPIHHVRLIQGERTATLPFPAFSLSRDVMDEALLKAAAARGAEIRRPYTRPDRRGRRRHPPGWQAVRVKRESMSCAAIAARPGRSTTSSASSGI